MLWQNKSQARQQGDSLMSIAFRRFKRHHLAITGFWVLVVLYLSAIFAGFVAPYRYDETFRQNANQPPTKIHFLDTQGKFHFQPFVYLYTLKIDKETFERKYTEDTTQTFPIRLLTFRNEVIQGGITTKRIHLFSVVDPGLLFIFGSDASGRDIFSRIIHGGRVSLSIGLAGILISFTIGMIVGGVAGYYGGFIDFVVMRFSEIIMMIPALFLMLTLRAAFLGLNLNSIQVYFMIIIILSFIHWAGLSRVIRGMVLSLREREFVLSAKTLGCSTSRLILKHILPNTFSFAIISATLAIPGYILGESALSVLGLGIVEPQASWGNMLSSAKNIATIEKTPWILIPGIFIFITILAFNFLGDGLRDALDPNLEV